MKDSIVNLPTAILDGIKDFFVPSDNYFSDKFEDLRTTLSDKLAIDSLTALFTSLDSVNSDGFNDINISIMGTNATILDADPINQNIETIRNWVRGFVFFFLVLYNINQVLKLIRGTDYIGAGGTNRMGNHVGRKE